MSEKENTKETQSLSTHKDHTIDGKTPHPMSVVDKALNYTITHMQEFCPAVPVAVPYYKPYVERSRGGDLTPEAVALERASKETQFSDSGNLNLHWVKNKRWVDSWAPIPWTIAIGFANNGPWVPEWEDYPKDGYTLLPLSSVPAYVRCGLLIDRQEDDVRCNALQRLCDAIFDKHLAQSTLMQQVARHKSNHYETADLIDKRVAECREAIRYKATRSGAQTGHNKNDPADRELKTRALFDRDM